MMSKRSLFSPGIVDLHDATLNLSTYCTLPRKSKTLSRPPPLSPSYVVRTGSLRRSRSRIDQSYLNDNRTNRRDEDNLEFPAYILQTGCYRWIGRAYHRDSFMAHRREFVEPEACIHKAEVSHETKEKFKSKKWKDGQAMLNAKQSHVKQDQLYSDSEKNPPSELELSNLSLYSDWEKKGSHPTSSKSMRFTSDALQGIRAARTEGASSSNNQRKLSSPPPPVAPKPYNRSLSERIPRDHNSVPLSSSSFNVSGSNVVSNNLGAPVLSLSSSQIHSSKSTPSLNSNESQVVLGRKFSQQQQIPENKKSHHHSDITHPSSFEKWKRSMDSLDTTPGNSHGIRSSRSNLHPQPPPCEIRTTKSGTLAPSSNPSHLMLDSLPDKSLSHHRVTTLDHSQHQISPPKHFHSNSDSGLSSLGGRTSTMSPVSTISSVSSGSSVSSRASLRSASIVSSSTLPGDGVNLIEEEADEELPVSSHSSPPSRHIFHSKKKKAATTHFQEEADCEQMFQYLARACESFSSSEKQKISIDSLQTLFFTSPNQRTLMEYVEGTLDIEFDDPFHSSDESKRIKQDELPHEKNSKGIKSSSGLCSTYNGFKSIHSSSDTFFPRSSKNDIEQIKADLLEKVDQKLSVLRSAQLALKENIKENEELGKGIAEQVKKVVSPCEYDKFDLHIQEMDKISNLLLGLSGRLARVENNLLALSIDGNRGDEIYRIRSEEGKLLLAKKDKLVDQLIEAKKLKQNIDRRSNLVAKILSKNLSNKSYSDYILFIKNKTRLLLDSREIYDKIKLGEEQMYALKTSSTS